MGLFLDAIRECCAGLDVHQANVVVCVLSGLLDRKPKYKFENSLLFYQAY